MKVYVEDIFGEKLELDVTRLDPKDVTTYKKGIYGRGYFIGPTLDVIDIQRYDETRIELRNGRKLHFPLTLKVSDSVDFLIDHEDIRRFYQLSDWFGQYGVRETGTSLLIDALISGRLTPKEVEEKIKALEERSKSKERV